MHGHMLDFKKRGTFIRLASQRKKGHPIPDFGYFPLEIPFSRKIIENVISGLFALGRTRLARIMLKHVPVWVLGPIFNFLRKFWKRISKPGKRRGLVNCSFVSHHNNARWQEITSSEKVLSNEPD